MRASVRVSVKAKTSGAPGQRAFNSNNKSVMEACARARLNQKRVGASGVNIVDVFADAGRLSASGIH